MKLITGIFLLALVTGCAQSGSDTPARPKINRQQYQDLLGLSDQGLANKASVGELGNCIIKDVGDGCADGPTYQVFLRDLGEYYPEMSAAPTSHGSACREYVGSYVRTALTEGFCFQLGSE